MERGEATSRETVLAAECRVTYVQGPSDFEPKRARRENKEGKRRKGWLNREEEGWKEKRVTLLELKRNSNNWRGKY